MKVKADMAMGFHDKCVTNFIKNEAQQSSQTLENTEENMRQKSSHLSCCGAESTMY